MRTKALALVAATTMGIEFLGYRQWHQRWGATPAEVRATMPGDDLLAGAGFTATRAITIAAAPTDVWSWLVQVGFGRAGFYSYDRVDNLGRPSARELLAPFQSPSIGDLAAPMAAPANEYNSFRCAVVDPPHELVWAKPDSTWSWRLTAVAGGGHTRLVTRLKACYRVTPLLPVTILLMELGDFPMMRKMLLGIRDRAETTGPGREPQADDESHSDRTT
jgi:hypothetical protein